ncbi:probable disease resistance protein At4g19060 [Humulus lupulus]|uniref:probable disease resistance protein At4g19060 n=1 Tax=Humulus lupulus TaxID=3486 RepID=UPI002B40D09F|nr:probable disease resistance protein At4g19060 [Humulus lupulus]
MERDIEKYLMDKLKKGLEGKESNNSSKIPMLTKFREIHSLLEKLLDPNSAQPVKQLGQPSFKEKLYSLDDLLTECQNMSTKKRSFHFPDISIKSKLNKIKAELRSALPQPEKVNTLSNGDANSWRKDDISQRRTTPTMYRSVDPKKIHGFEEHLETLKRLVLRQKSDEDDGFKAIAIVGAEGIGKTSLCAIVFDDEEVKKRFLPRVWVTMPRPSDEDYRKSPEIAIATRILASLGVEEEARELMQRNDDLNKLVCALHQELASKRYLIVLDQWYGHVSSSDDSADLKKGECLEHWFPKGCGGTVIVTSRNERVAKQMFGDEDRTVIPILPLRGADMCWAIFKQEVEKQEVEKDELSFNPPNGEELKQQVLEKCGGIPYRAKVLEIWRLKATV